MVEAASLPEGTRRLPVAAAHRFIREVFGAAGLLPEHARLSADVLVSADLCGIRSHGLARLPKFLDLINKGRINKNPRMSFTAGSDTTGIFDADHGPGMVASIQAMDAALSLAERHGTGFVAVRRTSHFGYPGYYVQRAMERGFIGLCMSNGARVVTPTFGLEPFMGSNPMSVGIPGGPDRQGFYLDMATAAVARGKIETYLREGREIPKGWVPEAFGPLRLDPDGILTFDVPLLPLGGEDPAGGGHKGYALSLMIELLCSLLVGQANPDTGHFMGAIKIASFREPQQVFDQMQQTFQKIRSLKKAPGRSRIYIPGELEAIAAEANRRLGIPVTPPVVAQMQRLNREMNLEFNFEWT